MKRNLVRIQWELSRCYDTVGARGGAAGCEALPYKPEGRGFDSRLDFFIDIILPMAPGSTQPLTEMSTRNISWGVKAVGA
jgi:hypothetical protein